MAVKDAKCLDYEDIIDMMFPNCDSDDETQEAWGDEMNSYDD